MNTDRKNVITGCLCAIGCETLFGLSYMFTKTAIANAGTFALLGWRFVIAVVFMSLLRLTGVIRISIRGKNRKPLLIVALLCPVIYFICETVGIRNTTSSESGVILASIPVVSLIASALILNKKPSRRQIIGIAITLIGVTITVLAGSAGTSGSLIGYVMLSGAVFAYALFFVYVDKASDFSEAEITYTMLVIGAVVFAVLAIVESAATGSTAELLSLPFVNRDFLITILYQGIGCSVFAFFLSNMAVARIGVNRMSSFLGVSMVVSILAGVLVLGEPFTVLQIVGAAVIISGVYAANSN